MLKLFIVAVAFGVVGAMDYEDAQKQHETYCEYNYYDYRGEC